LLIPRALERTGTAEAQASVSASINDQNHPNSHTVSPMKSGHHHHHYYEEGPDLAIGAYHFQSLFRRSCSTGMPKAECGQVKFIDENGGGPRSRLRKPPGEVTKLAARL
jgi:hypothetical protein